MFCCKIKTGSSGAHFLLNESAKPLRCLGFILVLPGAAGWGKRTAITLQTITTAFICNSY